MKYNPEYSRQRYLRLRNKLLADNKKYRKEHPEVGKKAMKKYLETHREILRERTREYRKENPGRDAGYNVGKRKSLRQQVLDLLGHRCARCGFSDERALQIDHIDGGGRKEVEQIGHDNMCKKIIQNGGAGYQILCANCNWIKRSENNEFYHKFR